MKTFKPEEPFFRGHFPGDPIVPGVILAEALAQAAGIAAGNAAGRSGSAKSYRLSAIKLMKFYQPARPNDEISLAAEKSGEVGGLLQFNVRATVGGEPVAEGSIVLSEA